jgi:hypothetical protein
MTFKSAKTARKAELISFDPAKIMKDSRLSDREKLKALQASLGDSEIPAAAESPETTLAENAIAAAYMARNARQADIKGGL